MAQLIGVRPVRKAIELAALRAVTDAMPEAANEGSVRAMRDQARY